MQGLTKLLFYITKLAQSHTISALQTHTP